MKNRILLNIGAILLMFSSDSKAANVVVEELTTSSEPIALVTGEVNLLGRGWENKKTGDYLALACTETATTEGTPCSQFRFIYFNAKINATAFVGNTYKIGLNQSEKTIKSWTKKFGKSFKHWKYEKYSRNAVTLIMGSSPGWAIGGATVISNVVPAAIIAANLGGFLALVMAPFVIGFTAEALHSQSVYLSLRNGDVKATIDQHGWNWSADPMNISNKKFTRLLNFITTNK